MKCLAGLLSFLTLPLLPYCSTEPAPPAEQDAAPSGAEEPATQDAPPAASAAERSTYTVVLDGQPLFKKPNPMFGQTPLAAGTVLTIVGEKGKYLEVQGEGELAGWIQIPKAGAGERSVAADRYIQNTVSSGINAGLVTKGAGTDKVARVEGVSPEATAAAAETITTLPFEFEEFEAFVEAGQLVVGWGESVEVPEGPQEVEAPAEPRQVGPVVGAIEGEGALEGMYRRIELKKLRERIAQDEHFFEHNLPLQEEEALGLDVALRLAAGRIVEDANLNRYVSLIGGAIVEHARRDDVTFRFTVIEDEAINAFAAPGGFIFITTGCIRACENEAELAAVLAHEVAHVDRRHGLRMMDAPQNRTRIARKMMGDEFGFRDQRSADTYAALSALADEHFQFCIQGWGRDFELEADEYGMRYLDAVGWDFRALTSFLEVLEATEGEEVQYSVGKAWASHPPARERIERLLGISRRLRLEPSGNFLPERFLDHTASLR